ncbi:MAG: hypothetical protein ACYDAR_09420 [Thermomicrobiales bacterium]
MERSIIQTMREHTPRLVLSRHAHEAVHGTGPLGRFNTWLALRITTVVGSMWCAYAFALLALISLPAVIRSGDALIIVAWIAQTFLQLVLLPIIIVGQNVQAAATDARAQADHETLTAIHTLTGEVHTINEQQTLILNLLAQRTENG